MVTEKIEIGNALEWVKKVVEYFRSYQPETKSMVVNYKTFTSEIAIFIRVPDDPKRKLSKIEIPAYQNFVIADMMDESFNHVTAVWSFVEGKWVLDPAKLPTSEKYFIVMSGKVPDDVVRQIVRVQPAMNKDSTDELDRFWLDSMLRNTEILEKIWDALNIEEVNVGVRVGIERFFSATIPKDIKRRLEVTQRFIRAGYGRDRNELFRAWHRMHQVAQESDTRIEDIIDAIYKLTSGELFSRYVYADHPYKIGEIRRDEAFKGIYPEKMAVEAKTVLNLKCPVATGYLNFKKKGYENELKDTFDSLKDEGEDK